MELKDTVEFMLSSDYKNRFLAEYYQTKIRYKKLSTIIEQYTSGKLGFNPTCSLTLLREQRNCMREYMDALEERAEIEGIELDKVV